MTRALCYALVYVMEGIIAHHYFSSLFVKKTKNWMIWLLICTTYLMMFGLSMVDNFVLNVTAFTLVNGLILLSCYTCRIRSAVFHAVIMSLVSTGAELIIMVILGGVFNDFTAFQKNDAILLLLCAASKCIYFFIMEMCILILGRKQRYMKDSGSTVLLLSVSPLASTIVMLAIIFIGYELPLTQDIRALIMGSTLLLLFANVLVFVAYGRHQKLTDQYLDAQLELSRQQIDEEYYHLLETHHQNQRILIHDIRSHLRTIQGLLQDKETTAAKQYLTDMEALPALNEKVRWCGNPTLNVLLRYYASECERAGVQLSVDIRHETIDFMEPMDINSLFRNLLQNALEAAQRSQDRLIELAIHKISPSDNTLILVSNSCDQPPIPLSSGLFLSRKKDIPHHGVGMRSIRHIVQKYHGEQNAGYDAKKRTFSYRIMFTQHDR